jgi:hypothetical protein
MFYKDKINNKINYKKFDNIIIIINNINII